MEIEKCDVTREGNPNVFVTTCQTKSKKITFKSPDENLINTLSKGFNDGNLEFDYESDWKIEDGLVIVVKR